MAVKVWDATEPSILSRVNPSGRAGASSTPGDEPLLLLHLSDESTTTGGSSGSSDHSQLAQFRSEVQLLSTLRHPNILQFFGLVPPLTLVRPLLLRLSATPAWRRATVMPC